jgi:BNR repeat-like domain
MRTSLRTAALVVATSLAVATAVAGAGPAWSAGGDTLVTVGSPAGPFSRNKQNEPAVAIDANHPTVVAAGSNDNIDMEACNAGADDTCPFTEGVGGSGVYFSFDSGGSWMQPTYQGLSARSCDGVVGDTDPDCVPQIGPIGTVPGYTEAGLVSDGDPALAFGPVYRNGSFSWDYGSRLYYANLASNLPGQQAFKGAEAIAVSRIDGPASTGLTPAIARDQSRWMAPVIASKQNSALFADKEQVWADNAESSRFFGNAYVCYAGFRSLGHGFTAQPLFVSTSTDGGATWVQKQVTPASNNPFSPQGFGRSGCTVRTDSDGTVYVFMNQFAVGEPGKGSIVLVTSNDGGATWSRPRTITTAYDSCNFIEDSIGRCVMDGIGGARSDLSSAPSVDIANGAPTGADATDQIVLTWVDARDGLNHEHVMFTSSPEGGRDWSAERRIEQGTDRGYYSAPAISPNGEDVYLVYNAFTTPFRDNTTSPRGLVGVVLHANVSGSGTVGAFTTLHRGEVGDPRASSQNNLAAEFLGDYVYAAATRTYGTAVWNDVRNGAVCGDINTYRMDLHDFVLAGGEAAEPEEPRGVEDWESRHEKGKDHAAADETPVAPAPQQDCPNAFGNTDIYGGSFPDPTP